MASEGIVMNTSRLRPKWTLGTMFLIVGWSSVVVWLNVRGSRPQREWWPVDGKLQETVLVHCGSPWTYAVLPATDPVFSTRLHLDFISYPALAANITIGLLAVVILTWTSRAILSALGAFMSKPPPADVDGD